MEILKEDTNSYNRIKEIHQCPFCGFYTIKDKHDDHPVSFTNPDMIYTILHCDNNECIFNRSVPYYLSGGSMGEFIWVDFPERYKYPNIDYKYSRYDIIESQLKVLSNKHIRYYCSIFYGNHAGCYDKEIDELLDKIDDYRKVMEFFRTVDDSNLCKNFLLKDKLEMYLYNSSINTISYYLNN